MRDKGISKNDGPRRESCGDYFGDMLILIHKLGFIAWRSRLRLGAAVLLLPLKKEAA